MDFLINYPIESLILQGDKLKTTLLMSTIGEPSYIGDLMLKKLINAGANVNFQNEYGKNPLMIVVYFVIDPIRSNNRLTMLLDAGTNIDFQTLDGGYTALMYATCGSDEMLATLLNAGANLFLRDEDEMTALMWIISDEDHEKSTSKMIIDHLKLNVEYAEISPFI